MKHLITVCGFVVVALVWLTPFVQRVLEAVWPIAAAATALVIGASAIALSVVIIGAALRSVKNERPIEIIPASPLVAFAREVTGIADDESHDYRWGVAVIQFCFIGNAVGFSVRRLQPHIERIGRQVYVDLLTSPGVLVTDKAGTRWGAGWNYPRLRNEIKHGLIELPYPTGDPPPVRWLQHSSAHTAHTPSTGEIVYSSPLS
ncbi:MAG: hypothetical protein FJ030_08565 [Chloroflexi bacterium]|nr:hypothetical protein [Chloroflexota bacterium]